MMRNATINFLFISDAIDVDTRTHELSSGSGRDEDLIKLPDIILHMIGYSVVAEGGAVGYRTTVDT